MKQEIEVIAHPNVRSEPRDANGRIIAWCAFGFLVAGCLMHLSLIWLYDELAERNMPSLVAQTVRPAPPAPRLQAKPDEAEAALRREQEARLHSYGWVDREHGIAHIPIERALELRAKPSQ